MWRGGDRMVGLARNRIGQHNIIKFGYRRKSDGQLSIPDPWYFNGDKLSENHYETVAHKGVQLVYIPFMDLELYEGRI